MSRERPANAWNVLVRAIAKETCSGEFERAMAHQISECAVAGAGMMPGINETLEKVAKAKGLDFSDWQGKLKKEGRFHVEVY